MRDTMGIICYGLIVFLICLYLKYVKYAMYAKPKPEPQPRSAHQNRLTLGLTLMVYTGRK